MRSYYGENPYKYLRMRTNSVLSWLCIFFYVFFIINFFVFSKDLLKDFQIINKQRWKVSADPNINCNCTITQVHQSTRKRLSISHSYVYAHHKRSMKYKTSNTMTLTHPTYLKYYHIQLSIQNIKLPRFVYLTRDPKLD